jgi:hypothetical protein
VILNEQYDFERRASPDVRVAFRGSPERVRLAAGCRLYRVLTEGHNTPVSERWFPETTYRDLRVRSGRLGVPMSRLAQSRLAMSRDWSPSPEKLCVAELLRDVYGFQGPAGYQRLDQADSRVLLPGNLMQLRIPGLEATDVVLRYYGEAGPP